jgi:hypothetical protein
MVEGQLYSSHSTRSGVELDGLFRWGDHVCHFFRSADDLSEVLVPYFKAGLERNELCLWVTASPYGKERAVGELRATVADFDRRVAAEQIQIFDEKEWYAKLALQRPAERVQCWLAQKERALASGYAGLRGSGNVSFLDDASWDDFLSYERAVSHALADERIVALCSYPVERRSADAVRAVTHCHRHGLAKRHGRWDLIEVRCHGGEASHPAHDPRATVQRPGGEVRQVIEDQLAIFMAAFPGRILLQGGEVGLSGWQATKLGIVTSELAANAMRHGALSTRQGKLAIEWRAIANGSRRLHIAWTESGMGGLTIPDKVGRGTQLLAGAVKNFQRVFDTGGMTCSFALDLGCDSNRRAQ